MSVRIPAINLARWEAFCLGWACLGVYLFLSAFFWASGPAPLRMVFYLFFVLPLLLVIPWRSWRMAEYGGQYTVSALIFAGYCVLTACWGRSSDIDFFFKQWLLLACWLGGIAWLFHYRPIDLQRLYLVVIVAGVVATPITLYAFYGHQDYSLDARLKGLGLIENPTIVAQVFGVASLLAYLKSLQEKNGYLSFTFFIAAMICGLVVLMSQSRGAALALVVAACSGLLIVRPRPRIWVPHLILALVSVVALSVVFGLNETLEKRGLDFSFRDVIWIELLNRSLEHPLLGRGLEQDARIILDGIGVFHHAHNTWIDIFYYTGLIGLLLALWHWILLVRSFNRHRDALPLYLWLVYGCLCLFNNGSGLLTRPDAQWLMYWIPAGLLAAWMTSRRGCQIK